MEEQLETLFSNGRDNIQRALFEQQETSTPATRTTLVLDSSFREILRQQQIMEVPDEVVSYLIREGFPEELQLRLSAALSRTLKKPIVNTAIHPPLPSGYLLVPVEDSLRENETIISISAARAELQASGREIFASAGSSGT